MGNIEIINREKTELRKKIKLALKENASKMQTESEIICRKILASDEYKTSDVILSYMPLPQETDIFQVTKQALADGKKVFIPRVYPNEKSPVIKFHEFSTQLINENGNYGIKEPSESAMEFSFASKCRKILILVPGVAFTKTGKRLGHGKAYYDCFLSKLPSDKKIIKAGVCFSFQITEDIPSEKHDILMDLIFSI
ncbi:MAG: 5-formyltetrahydrofolate cyclo-ligase [Spirochaetales bacterium]|nr:5-formyltetrahydrofolate cyclo-ligase [Spirochaetales bacterium]